MAYNSTIIGTRVSRTEVTNGIYNAIRLKLIELNHLPDIRSYNTQTAWENALEAFKTNNPNQELILLRGDATPEDQKGFTTNTIYLKYFDREKGRIKGKSQFIYEQYKEDEGTPDEKIWYRKYKVPGQTYDLVYELRYVAETSKIDALIESIIIDSLGDRKYLEGVKEDFTTTQKFLLEETLFTDVPGGRYYERMYRYTARNVFLQNKILIDDRLASASDIQVQLNEDNVTKELPEG